MYQKISKNKNTYKIPPIGRCFFIISIWYFFIQYDIIIQTPMGNGVGLSEAVFKAGAYRIITSLTKVGELLVI